MNRRRSFPLGLMVAGVLGCNLPASGGSTPLTTERVALGLTDPVYVTHAPGDFDRIFIVEQVGRIRILDISVEPPVLQPSGAPFLNIISRVQSGGERGLLGLAFHPDFQTNGYFYVNYTTSVSPSSGDTRVSRFEVPMGTPDDADEASELILMTIDQPQGNHNGGWISFSPEDDYLYIAMGDGGNFDDWGTGHTANIGNALDTDKLLGKMLRIDVDGNDGPGGLYGIPADNPFADAPGRDEIWAFGLRNPWRNAFDSLTGDLYIADVGQGAWEEINFQPASSKGGENWGWRCREGAHNFNGTEATVGCGQMTLLDPIHEYSHSFGCSISGGEVYRGCAIPDLQGTYFFADWCSNRIWSLVYTGGSPTVQSRESELAPGGGLDLTSIVAFGRDAAGEIYICEQGDGEVFKIVPDGVESQCGLPVPAASAWGMIVMTMALLAAGTLALRRRQPV